MSTKFSRRKFLSYTLALPIIPCYTESDIPNDWVIVDLGEGCKFYLGILDGIETSCTLRGSILTKILLYQPDRSVIESMISTGHIFTVDTTKSMFRYGYPVNARFVNYTIGLYAYSMEIENAYTEINVNTELKNYSKTTIEILVYSKELNIKEI